MHFAQSTWQRSHQKLYVKRSHMHRGSVFAALTSRTRVQHTEYSVHTPKKTSVVRGRPHLTPLFVMEDDITMQREVCTFSHRCWQLASHNEYAF